jgi:hypothetical protein
VTRIENSNGNTIATFTPQINEVLDEVATYKTNGREETIHQHDVVEVVADYHWTANWRAHCKHTKYFVITSATFRWTQYGTFLNGAQAHKYLHWDDCVRCKEYNKVLYFVDRVSLYNLVNKTNLVRNLFLVYFVNLYMFWASLGPSSGGTTVYMRHLVLVILRR